MKNDVADASLACAEGLAAAGKKDEAGALYQAVAQADLPKHLHVAALTGHIQLLGAEGVELVIAQLRCRRQCPVQCRAGCGEAGTGSRSGHGSYRRTGQARPARHALLLRALGDRPEGVPESRLVEAAKSQVSEVRSGRRVCWQAGHAFGAAGSLGGGLGRGGRRRGCQRRVKVLPGRGSRTP